MKANAGKIVLRTLVILSMIAIPALIVVWATEPPDNPDIDGELDPNNEYNEVGCEDYDAGNNPGMCLTGAFSKCYSRYIPDEGLYILNDWYDPNENYDPNDPNGCDGMNRFDWTDKGFNPWKYWRVQVHGNCTADVMWMEKKQGDTWHEVNDPNADGWRQRTGYHTSKNDPDEEHPIWELKIPCSAFSGTPLAVGIIDPHYMDPNDCPSVEDYENAGESGSPIGLTPIVDTEELPSWPPPPPPPPC